MATIGQNAREMKKLFEASMSQGAVTTSEAGEERVAPGSDAFVTNLEQLVGIECRYTPGGKRYKKYNPAKVKIPLDDLDIAAFGMEIAGHKWPVQFEQQAMSMLKGVRFEALAPPQMASSLPITCAINDAYGIFLDGRVYQEEADESYIGEDFCEVVEPIVDGRGAVVNGGFRAGRRTAVQSNDPAGVDVGEAIIPPGMGQELETLLHINRARLNARQYSWTLDSVKFNRIADDVSKAVNAARVVKYEEERKVADAVLGVGSVLASSTNGNIGDPGYAMPVEVGGLEFYPYQNGSWGTGGGSGGNAGQAVSSPLNGTYEQNYANAYDTNGKGIVMATLQQVLAQRILNRDPFTGDVIPGNLKGDTIFVANDAAEVQLLTLLQQWFIGQWGMTVSYGNTGPATPSTFSLYNFAKEQGLTVKKSQRWANRLTDVGVLTDEATIGTFLAQKLTFSVTDSYNTAGSVMSFFVIGRPKECIGKHLLQPYMVEDFNVPGDMQMRGIAGLRKVSERSQTFFKDVPRRLNRAYA